MVKHDLFIAKHIATGTLLYFSLSGDVETVADKLDAMFSSRTDLIGEYIIVPVTLTETVSLEEIQARINLNIH